MSKIRVLSVGQCGFDNGQISRYFAQTFGAVVVPIDSQDEAIQTLRDSGGFDLVLANRLGALDRAPGLKLIQTIKADPDLAKIPVLLVSNYESAQEEAVAQGALPGFGKAELGTSETEQKIRSALKLQEAKLKD